MIKKYLSLVKFSHTIFAMPFAFIGYFIAIHQPEGEFSFTSLLLVILCMVFGRNAAMGFNRWADADIDAENPRTKVREIPSGKIKKNAALWFVILNCVAFLVTTYFINRLCFYLAPFVLAIILGYSYTKRFTALCHLILGLGLAIAPLGAYLAVLPEWNPLIILISFIVLTWVSGFDIIYSLQDADYDREHNLNSIPSLVGRTNALLISTVLHVMTAIFIIVVGYYGNFTLIYWIGAVLFILLLTYQHLLVKPNDLSKVNIAFFTTNGIASLLFSIAVIADLYV